MNIAAYFAQRELDQHRLATAAQHTRPTVFELMACEQLQASVRPALRYALSVGSSARSERPAVSEGLHLHGTARTTTRCLSSAIQRGIGCVCTTVSTSCTP